MRSRRPDARFNRGRVVTVAGAESPSNPAAELVADMLAATTRTNVWMVLGDLGVNQATTPGRVSSLTSQGGANNWTTLAALNEPLYTASDASIGGRGTWSTNGTNRYMLCAYDPPAPLTQPHYRIGVVRMDVWGTLRFPEICGSNNILCARPDTKVRQAGHIINGVQGPTVDYPSVVWCIVEVYFSGSTSDFITVGPLNNTATGVSAGNTDPTPFSGVALAMGASITGAGQSSNSYAFSAAFLGLPTAPERDALRQLLIDYYGSQLLRTRKVCRYYFTGDSITRGASATSLNGYRKALHDEYFTALGYPVYSTGAAADGTYGADFIRHGCTSGSTIASLTTILADPATGQLRAGGPQDGCMQLVLLMTGTNSMSTYVAGTTVGELRTLMDSIQSLQPNVRQVVTTIPPQGAGGNNANVILFNAELPAMWDAFDAANPTRTCIRWDANTAIGGPSYVGANFVDDLHPNDTGHALIGAALVPAVASILNTLTTF